MDRSRKIAWITGSVVGIGVIIVAAALASSGGGAAGAPSTATSTLTAATSTTSLPCVDFSGGLYNGASISKANEVIALGWKMELWDKAGSTSWTSGANGKTWLIGGVQKNDLDCMVRFEVVEGPPISPPVPAGPLTTVSDGTYLVGTDMAAGSYKSPGGVGCYWARMKDDSGRNIIANNIGDGPSRFTAKQGEYVKVSRCTFTKV